MYLVALFGTAPSAVYVPELRPFKASRLEDLDRAEVARVRRGLPASRLVLLRTIPFLSLLSAAEIVDYLERADPGRYWAASLLTTAVLATSGPDNRGEFRIFPTREEFAKILARRAATDLRQRVTKSDELARAPPRPFGARGGARCRGATLVRW